MTTSRNIIQEPMNTHECGVKKAILTISKVPSSDIEKQQHKT